MGLFWAGGPPSFAGKIGVSRRGGGGDKPCTSGPPYPAAADPLGCGGAGPGAGRRFWG